MLFVDAFLVLGIVTRKDTVPASCVYQVTMSWESLYFLLPSTRALLLISMDGQRLLWV